MHGALLAALLAVLAAVYLFTSMGSAGPDGAYTAESRVGLGSSGAYEANYTFSTVVEVSEIPIRIEASGWFVEGRSGDSVYILGEGVVGVFGKASTGPHKLKFWATGDGAVICIVGMGCKPVDYTAPATSSFVELVRRHGSRRPGECGVDELVGDLYVINKTLSIRELANLTQLPGGSIIDDELLEAVNASAIADVCVSGDVVLWANATISVTSEAFGFETHIATKTSMRLVSMSAYNATRAREVLERVTEVLGGSRGG